MKTTLDGQPEREDGMHLSPKGGFLGVSRSVLGRQWRARPVDPVLAQSLVQRLRISDLVAGLLAARGVSLAAAPSFLAARLRDWLPDPAILKDMDRAVARIADALKHRETIALFGDYDVDGATASALFARYLKAMGQPPLIYIPDRLQEGYGPNPAALTQLQNESARLVITLDCGATAYHALRHAQEIGLEVIVIDHHIGEADLPPAYAIVNPNRLDEDHMVREALGHLAAVGVAFLVLVALNRRLREEGFFSCIEEPDLLQWLDLVALGTICDVVPLNGINRALAGQGLKVMAQRRNAGLRALMDSAGMGEPPTAYHAGFILGPRINAGGRMGYPSAGVTLLTAEDTAASRQLAGQLQEWNAQRQAIEAAALQDAMEEAARCLDSRNYSPAILVLAREGWHAGIIGLLASRLKERFQRAVCVVALEGGMGKGSGRSVSGVDLGSAVIAARQAGFLEQGGGHAMAAGFSVREDKLAALQDFFDRHVGPLEGLESTHPLDLDGVLAPGAASLELIDELEKLGPFGAGNEEPCFAISSGRLVEVRVVGEQHVSCQIVGIDGRRIRAIAFRALGTPLGPALMTAAGTSLHFAGYLRRNRYRERQEANFVITDAAAAGG